MCSAKARETAPHIRLLWNTTYASLVDLPTIPRRYTAMSAIGCTQRTERIMGVMHHGLRLLYLCLPTAEAFALMQGVQQCISAPFNGFLLVSNGGEKAPRI